MASPKERVLALLLESCAQKYYTRKSLNSLTSQDITCTAIKTRWASRMLNNGIHHVGFDHMCGARAPSASLTLSHWCCMYMTKFCSFQRCVGGDHFQIGRWGYNLCGWVCKYLWWSATVTYKSHYNNLFMPYNFKFVLWYNCCYV